MTPEQLQSLRNLGNDCEAAADEIDRLRAERDEARALLREARIWLHSNTSPLDLVERIDAALKDAP